MKTSLAILATLVSGLAVFLAVDPGRFAYRYVDAGGHSVRMLIRGQGGPAVVFETGGAPSAGGPLEAWQRVQPAVSQWTTTVSYDRAGCGWSAPGPKPRDAQQVARELHTALGNAHVAPPYVLVGHSFGGPLVRVFAGLYPQEVAGLVLVEPTQEEFIEWNRARTPQQPERQDAEWKDIQASLAEAHRSRVPPGVPVVLITGMRQFPYPSFVPEKKRQEDVVLRQMWLKCHEAWLSTVPNGRHVITEKSGHLVPFEQPELIVATLRTVCESARSRSH